MIRYANKQDLIQIRALWELCFPDDSGFNDYFFANLFDLNHVLLLEIDNEIAAMTQMIPRKIRLSEERSELCTYIYGACTHPKYRRKHLMSRLLEQSFLIDFSLGRTASILIPAEKWLFDFYKLFKYEPVFMLNTKELESSICLHHDLSMLSADSIPVMNALYETAFAKDTPFLLRETAEWKRQIKMFSEIGMGCFGKHAPNGELLGYAFAWKPAEDMIYVQEVIACSEYVKLEILESVAALANVNKIRYSDTAYSAEPLGCMKRYDDQKISTCYMNLMLN